MDKSTPATIRATCRDQFEPEHCPAQKTQKSAVLAPHIMPQPQHDGIMDIKYAIDLPELAAAIGANPRSLRNAFYLHPDDFPPAIYLPGCCGVRFLVSDIPAWLESHKAPTQASTPAPVTKPTKGRPRKASAAQIARARQRKVGVA